MEPLTAHVLPMYCPAAQGAKPCPNGGLGRAARRRIAQPRKKKEEKKNSDL